MMKAAESKAKKTSEEQMVKMTKMMLRTVRQDVHESKEITELKAQKALLEEIVEDYNEQVLGEYHDRMGEHIPENIREYVHERCRTAALAPIEGFSNIVESLLRETSDKLEAKLATMPTDE